MTTTKWNEKINVLLTSIFVFFLPLYPYVLPIIIVLIILNWLIVPANIYNSFKKIIVIKGLLGMVGLYLLYLIGLIYSSNTKSALNDLETKFSLLILPLIYVSYQDATTKNVNSYLRLFVFGCLTYSLCCFSWAAYSFFKPIYTDLYGVLYDMGANYFYYTYLSIFFHPSYTAMYTVFALACIAYLSYKGGLKLAWWWNLIVAVFVIFILLLSSKAGWLGLLLLILSIALYQIVRKKNFYFLFFVFLSVGLFFILNVYYAPSLSNRIPKVEVIGNAIKEKNNKEEKVTTGSDGSGSRIFVWKASLELIKENFWMGVGTGDSRDKLFDKYLEKNMLTEFKYKLNSHNQYLNTFISIGIVGLGWLLLGIFFSFYYAIKERRMIWLAFLFIVAFNFLFESMLEVQAGVVFYAFFNSLFISVVDNNV